MPDLAARWRSRAADFMQQARDGKARLQAAATKDETLAARMKFERARLQAEFWRHMVDRLEACPHLLPEAAVGEITRHSLYRDLWATVAEDLKAHETA